MPSTNPTTPPQQQQQQPPTTTATTTTENTTTTTTSPIETTNLTSDLCSAAAAAPTSPHTSADAARAMSTTDSWKPAVDRRQSWSQQDYRHQVQMSRVTAQQEERLGQHPAPETSSFSTSGEDNVAGRESSGGGGGVGGRG